MASERPLQDLRVLVVEDEYFIATDLKEIVRAAGARSVRLSGSMEDAVASVTADAFDVALLDINLRSEPAYGIADLLVHRRIPFAFLTGYDRGMLPKRFDRIPLWGKPYVAGRLVRDLCALGKA